MLSLVFSLLATGIAVSPVFLFSGPPTTRQSNIVPASNQLTQCPSAHYDPVFSPDGQQIAFSSNASGSFQIWVMDDLGSHLVKLTSLGGNQLSPEWNPAKREIAFLSVQNSSSAITILSTITNRLAKICDGYCSNETTFDWSPSGSFIVYNANFGSKSEIFITNTLTWKETELTPRNQAENLDPKWSSDGRWILFSSNSSGSFEIYEMNTTGGNLRQLSSGRGDDFAPLMSPDGKYVAFTSNSSGEGNLWLMKSNGSDQQPVESNPLKQKPGLDYSPSVTVETRAIWRPDGRALLFDTTQSDLMAFYLGVTVINYNGASRGAVQLGNALVALSREPIANIEPSWRPDGGAIVFASNQAGCFNLYTQIFSSASPNPYG